VLTDESTNSSFGVINLPGSTFGLGRPTAVGLQGAKIDTRDGDGMILTFVFWLWLSGHL